MENERKMKCSKCQGEGWTAEHDSGVYSHDENGNCLGNCPIQVECEYCKGTGIILEGRNDGT